MVVDDQTLSKSQVDTIPEDAYLGRLELARRLGVAAITIDRAAADGRLVKSFAGRRVLFRGAAVHAWLSGGDR